MLKPKKSLGQNFLKDKNLCIKIVEAVNYELNDTVIEIGPGTGALTEYLIRYDINLKLIEIDERAISFLNNKYSDFNNYEIIPQSILDLDFNASRISSDRKLKVIGNIPYYISGRIFYRLFENSEIISEAVLTVQKEVAERIVSSENRKEYGILSVAAWVAGSAQKLFDIPPQAFYPQPKVTSSVVKLVFEPKISASDFNPFMNFIKAAFNQRRKMISNSLKPYFGLNLKNSSDFLEYSEIWNDSKNLRPEQISPQQFLNLYKEITRHNEKQDS